MNNDSTSNDAFTVQTYAYFWASSMGFLGATLSVLLSVKQWNSERKSKNLVLKRLNVNLWTIFLAMAVVDLIGAIYLQVGIYREHVSDDHGCLWWHALLSHAIEIMSICLTTAVAVTLYLRFKFRALGSRSPLLGGSSAPNHQGIWFDMIIAMATIIGSAAISVAYASLFNDLGWYGDIQSELYGGCWIIKCFWKRFLGTHMFYFISISVQLMILRKLKKKHMFNGNRFILISALFCVPWFLQFLTNDLGILLEHDLYGTIEMVGLIIDPSKGISNFVAYLVASDLIHPRAGDRTSDIALDSVSSVETMQE